MSMVPSARLKVSRFMDAKLQAVSSRNMYSEHGLDALMRPDAPQVCHSLMVVSYWRPGSAQAQAASPIRSQSSRALMVFDTLPSVRRISFHSLSAFTASRNSFVSRTELFEFWPETVR